MKLPWHTITIWALLLLATYHSYRINALEDQAVDAENAAISAQMDADEALAALDSIQHPQPKRATRNGI